MIMKSNNCMTLKIKHIISHISTGVNKFSRVLGVILILMEIGAGDVWGQIDIDFSGKYCIANKNGYNSAAPETNYYLVPATNSNYNNNTSQPHLTTYRSGRVSTSYWTIEKSGDYYHIIYADGRYLTANTFYDGTTGNDQRRLRVHLEQMNEPDNNTLFIILPNVNGGFNIKHKDISDDIYLDPAGGNINNTGITNLRTMSTSNGTVNVGGGIGYWTDEEAARWVFEDIVETPTVSIDNDGKAVISSSNASATYYFTKDGTTKPTTGSTLYEEPIDITGIETIKTIAVVNDEVSNVATYTVGNGTPYIIQNQECTAYYLISGDATAANVPAHTSSIYGPKMEWLLKYAGNVNGIQYYYFVNNATGNYLYRTGDNVYIKSFVDNTDGYKFNFFTQNTNGSYNIFPKDVTNKSLYKKNGNVASDNVVLSNDLTHLRGQWNFIPTSGITDKRSLFEDSPVGVSKHYKIENKNENETARFIISPVESEGIEYAGVSNTETNDNMVWRFEEAGHDEWQTYYNIYHATTGKYMYYAGNATTTSAQTNAIRMIETLTDDIRFQFVLARATDADYYYIIPKTHKDIFKSNQYYAIWLSTSILKTTLSRSSSANNVKWKFEETTTFIAPPTITFSADDMKVFMQSLTQDITGIQYDVTKNAETAPTSASTDYPNGGIDVKYGPVYHFAAKTNKGGNSSILITKDLDLSYIAIPTISLSGNTVTFSNSQKGMTFYYTTNGSMPKYTDKNAVDNNGTAIESNQDGTASISLSNELYSIRVIAVSIMDDANETGYSSSSSDIRTIDLRTITEITSLNQIDSKTGRYHLNVAEGTTVSGTPSVGSTEADAFEGFIDGNLAVFSLSAPLFKYVKGDATIKNVIVASGDISGNGAIAEVAKGDARIYNCGYLGGTITGSGNVGGLVGEITDNARVINCYSFATVKGGSLRGGIVGNNNVTTASQKGSINTMVMNCMFYGTIDGDGAPVYNGTQISNAGANGLNNFNYYSYADFEGTPSPYNCALAAEKIYLERFEFHRNILNSNRELAAWYATGSTGNSGDMAKWVLDKSIAKYPILKKQGYYPSVINYEDAPSSGSITVNVNLGSNYPSGATIGSCPARKIYGKDITNHHYNDKTIRLPYYWEVQGTGNYTDNKVMTGWEVTVNGGTKNFTGTFTYNFANRDYSAYSGRVFSQGAYLDIPDGATSVTLTAHWADCVYLSDPTYDITYSTSYSPTSVDDMGTRYGGDKKFNNQTVYTTFSAALSALAPAAGTVYDHAIVLVGNYHQYCGASSLASGTGPFTVMSADLNEDSEPDYTFFYQQTQRRAISPIRFDFLNFPGVGLGQKVTGTTNMAAQGIFQPQGWFEVTNTCLVHFTQFEYDMSNKAANSPVILLGGIYDQFVSGNNSVGGTSYIHLGSNAYFPNDFCNGTHIEKTLVTPHIPISVTGGEYKKFYLSGTYRPDVTPPSGENVFCFVDGGYFKEEVAGAGQEKIDGNVTWYIANADMSNFYGGGINDAKSITGDITVNIKDSKVTEYCGGPKFGNMSSGKKVITTATDCIFGKFFGAGYGGTSFYRYPAHNEYQKANYAWDTWAGEYEREYNAERNGISVNYEYEYVDKSGAANDNQRVGRFFINYASLSLAVTQDVKSTLTGCTINTDFFGGGNLGRVDGDIESKLTDCTVFGNVFGAGFSAAKPKVEVWPRKGFKTLPSYDGDAGVYNNDKVEFPDTDANNQIKEFTWEQKTEAEFAAATSKLDDTNNLIFTTKDLATLGQVKGKVELTLDGETTVGTLEGESLKAGTGNVYGGGDQSAVINITDPANASTFVTLSGKTEVLGNVFGGGNQGDISGSTTVNIVDGE